MHRSNPSPGLRAIPASPAGTANGYDLYIKRKKQSYGRAEPAAGEGEPELEEGGWGTGPTDWEDPDAGEIRTGAGSLQLDRRNPCLVVFCNLRPARMMYCDSRGRKTCPGDCRSIIRPVCQLDVWHERVAVRRRLCRSGLCFICSPLRIQHSISIIASSSSSRLVCNIG